MHPYAFITEVGAPVWRATLICAVYSASTIATAVYSKLSNDIYLRAHCGGNRRSDAAAHDPTLQARAHELGLTRLCSNVATSGGAISSGLATRSLAFCRFAGKKSAQRIVRTTAASALAMSEVLFISSIMQMGLALPMAYYSSSYNDRIAIEYHGRSSDAATDARRINHARRRLHLAVAGQSSSANDHVCASRDRWYGAWPRSLTRSRPASCDAI